MVRIPVSFWDGLFSGPMLVSGSVTWKPKDMEVWNMIFPWLPVSCWVTSILDPKNIPSKHRTSGAIWKMIFLLSLVIFGFSVHAQTLSWNSGRIRKPGISGGKLWCNRRLDYLIPSCQLALPNTACWCLGILSIGSEGEILGGIIYGKSSCLQSKYCFQIVILFDSIFS